MKKAFLLLSLSLLGVMSLISISNSADYTIIQLTDNDYDDLDSLPLNVI